MAGFVLVTAPGCASRSKTPNADELQEQTSAAHADFRRMITVEIADPARAAIFAGLADERDALMTRHSASVQAYAESMKTLNSDYTATRDAFEKLVRDYDSDRRGFQAGFVGLIAEMKAVTTEDEWRKLSKFDIDALGPPASAISTGGN
ncbi:MAG: hypothetical protein V2I24_13000 [Halieaceae bacterium]|nr:hypothetical protein [Halieaceae bacterium]